MAAVDPRRERPERGHDRRRHVAGALQPAVESGSNRRLDRRRSTPGIVVTTNSSTSTASSARISLAGRECGAVLGRATGGHPEREAGSAALCSTPHCDTGRPPSRTAALAPGPVRRVDIRPSRPVPGHGSAQRGAQRRHRPDAEHLAQGHPRRVVAARPVHRGPGRGRRRREVHARHRRLVGVPARHRAGPASAAAWPGRWRCRRRGSSGSTAPSATAFFVYRSTTVSRNPGANRSIWFSMASVMSTSAPCGTCT